MEFYQLWRNEIVLRLLGVITPTYYGLMYVIPYSSISIADVVTYVKLTFVQVTVLGG
jgi:hypothetical protein